MKRKDKKIVITLLSVVAILIIGGMFVPISVSARVILARSLIIRHKRMQLLRVLMKQK
ncbi:hypothetical protein [Geomicrobium sp. JCM 19038]|uniref:hypothetical protein n=1 Tax=Geomicrobium sp. JCM 19038 TaxID=1460635 RepID=UPI00187CED9D|nr:hypothetical protein [Geomicrobium sp. JCM 19038]